MKSVRLVFDTAPKAPRMHTWYWICQPARSSSAMRGAYLDFLRS
jgi:hypothetical protein